MSNLDDCSENDILYLVFISGVFGTFCVFGFRNSSQQREIRHYKTLAVQ